MQRYVSFGFAFLLSAFLAMSFYACGGGGGGGESAPSAGVTITPTSVDVSEEGPTSATYDVDLGPLAPTEEVTIAINFDSAQVIVSSSSLIFAVGETTKTVTVTAENDGAVEGTHTSTITHTATSADTNYDGITIDDVTVTITDNDGTVNVNPASVNVAEGGATATYDIVLGPPAPTADVTVTITPDSQTTVDANTLTFLVGETTKTVTVTAVNDSAVEGTHTSTITHTAASADPIYDNFNANNVTATITDNDRFAFVANRTSGDISIYNVDPSTGALSPDPGSTFLIDAAPGSFAVAAHPSGEFLYVANADNDTVSALAIDSSTGGLSLIEAEIAAANAQPFSVAVDRTGSFLYVANIGDGTVSAYSINQSTGELTPIGNPVASGTQARFVAPHPTADFLYVANEGDNNFSGFIINPGGSLAPILGANPSPYSSIFPTGKRPRGLAIDPTGQYLYTANYDPASNTGSITAFQIDDGTMGGDTGSLIWISDTDTGERTRSVATHPNGGFVYALNERTANIDAFAIDDGSTGGTPGDLISPSTVPGSPFPTSAAANPPNNDDRSYTVTVDSNGNFAFATNFVDGTVDSFVINAADGSLSGRTTVSAGSGPAGITILGVLP